MPETIRDMLIGRQFLVTIRADGEVDVQPSDGAAPVWDAPGQAACNEIESALEDALQGGQVGGYEFDEETSTVVPIAG